MSGVSQEPFGRCVCARDKVAGKGAKRLKKKGQGENGKRGRGKKEGSKPWDVLVDGERGRKRVRAKHVQARGKGEADRKRLSSQPDRACVSRNASPAVRMGRRLLANGQTLVQGMARMRKKGQTEKIEKAEKA